MKPMQSILRVCVLLALIASAAAPVLSAPADVASTPANREAPTSGFAVSFDGTDDYVTFDAATSTLGVKTFTLETWFKRTGQGVATSTGTGGVTSAIPLLTKGRGEGDGTNVDMNYFLGIDSTTNVLAADFEECAPAQVGCPAGQAGLNHPVSGTTPIHNGVWNHAAVTYDGQIWRLYLNGKLDGQVDVGANRLPRWDSIQHAGLGTAMTSTGSAAGFFQGVLDETRIWNVVRTQQEIQDNLGVELTAGAGLLGRWGLNDGSGTTATNSIAGSPNGALTNGPLWVDGTTFAFPDALGFGGTTATDGYVTFGDPAALDLAQFTVETWFKREATGVAASTGTGGVSAIPLVTKGRGEGDNSTLDMNYFLGIRASDGVLAADFEEGAAGASPGLNHPIVGATPVQNNTWYHAAVTYDGAKWQLFLNGNLENELVVGQPPRSDSIQHAALASALNSTGVPEGYFYGVLDEVRIWNYARTQAQIQTTVNSKITDPQAGLVARWSLDEAAGRTVNGSAGTTVNGTGTSNDFGWANGAPFDISFPTEPPVAPTALNATAQSHAEIALAWTDNATTETSFKIERCTGAGCSDFSLRATVGSNTTSYSDTGLSAATTYCYRVKASNLVGDSAPSNVDCDTTAATINYALDLSNTSAGNLTYVNLGNPSELRLQQVTIETWFRRDGQGVSNTTGTGGIAQGVPLVARGAAEAENALVDLNYFLGIDDATDTLAADFEEGASGGSPSLNHPVYGVTTLSTGVWYHAAATYDGTTWKLYLNGNLEATLAVNQPLADATDSVAAIATSLRSNGTTAQGGFDGALDEARIWSVARSQAEIQASMHTKFVTPQPNLVARWGMDENMGSDVNDAARSAVSNGVITGANSAWIGGPAVAPPGIAVSTPVNGATGVGLPANIQVAVSDPEAEPLTVTFYGRPAKPSTNPAFTVVMLPDTQNYSASYAATFSAQTQWIVANRNALNIPYVAQVGDCVNDASVTQQWINADAAIDLLEDPVTTGLAEGMPYGIAVGNHDQDPNGNPDGGSTSNYNQYFGISRFAPGGVPRGYYAGPYGANNDNMVELFSAGGMDFLAIYFEYDTTPNQSVLDWADSLLRYYPLRRGIVVTHNMIGTGNPGAFSTQGQAIYNALRDNPNLFLMLGGHVPGEGRRQDTFDGIVVNTLLADYQSRSNGGDGWLRRLDFDPAAEQINVKTYSPTLNQSETDADSQFTLGYIQGDLAFQQFGVVASLASGSTANVDWSGLTEGELYEWYVTVSDGKTTTTSPVWRFTAGAPLAVALASFEATPQSDHVLVAWETESEINNRGFNLYRATTPTGPQQQLNAALIPSQSPGSGQGYAYTYDDLAVQPGQTYWYWLEDLDLSGATTLHGPVSVVFNAPTAVTLSRLEAGTGAGSALPLAGAVTALFASLGAAYALRRKPAH